MILLLCCYNFPTRSVTERMPIGFSRGPRLSITTNRWIFLSRSRAASSAIGVVSETLMIGALIRCLAVRPRQCLRYGSTNRALTRSVREITPIASPASSTTTRALMSRVFIVSATTWIDVSGPQVITPRCIQSLTSASAIAAPSAVLFPFPHPLTSILSPIPVGEEDSLFAPLAPFRGEGAGEGDFLGNDGLGWYPIRPIPPPPSAPLGVRTPRYSLVSPLPSYPEPPVRHACQSTSAMTARPPRRPAPPLDAARGETVYSGGKFSGEQSPASVAQDQQSWRPRAP